MEDGQEIRGLRLEDETGHVIGLITDLMVDTDAGYVDAIVLDTGQEVSADDIELGSNVVYLRRPSAQHDTGRPVERVEGLRVPIVEERPDIGKRQIERGGVRVTTEVEDVPVHEEVSLRQESVDVQRAPAHRPAAENEIDEAFMEATFEVRALSETIAVRKELFVVEEIHIRKEVAERTETIQDSVRQMRVDIEELSDQAGTV